MPRDRDMEPLITKAEGDNVHPRKVDPNKIVDSFFYLSILYVSIYLAMGSILYYFVFTLKDNTSKDADYVDTLYFCLVTLTTLDMATITPMMMVENCLPVYTYCSGLDLLHTV